MNPKKKRAYQKEYAAAHRKKLNDYARDYYKKNRDKHIARVLRWKKNNPEKIKEYISSPKVIAAKKARLRIYITKNKAKIREYRIKWVSNKRLKDRRAKIIVEGAVKRKYGYKYWIDNEGNLCGVRIKRWGKKK